MLNWILAICVFVFIVSCFFAWKFDSEGSIVVAVLFAIMALVVLAFIFILNADVKGADVIKEKIEMYEEENSEIESEISTLVTQYMAFEQDTLETLKVEGSLVTLVNLYPELKSDELVQAQIQLYISNQHEIIKLKEDLIDLGIKKIWLGIKEE